MSSKIWRATGEYLKDKRTFTFSMEMVADKETHVREQVYSEIGSRHRVKRRRITFAEVKEIKEKQINYSYS